MKTLKKTLCLVLAVVMVVGVLIIPANAAEIEDYPDVDEIKNEEAVAVLTGLGIMTGDEDGFRPGDTLTRAEAAKIVVYLMADAVTADACKTGVDTKFPDVPKTYWGSGYIGYLADLDVVSGDENGKFNPDDKVLPTEFAKMLLGALGYSAQNEGFTGEDYETRVRNVARNIAGLEAGAALALNGTTLTRDVAAQMAFNALKAAYVKEYQGNFHVDLGSSGSVSSSGTRVLSNAAGGETFYNQKYGTTLVHSTTESADAFGHIISEKWTYNDTTIYEKAAEPALHYETAVDETKVTADFTAKGIQGAGTTLNAYVDSNTQGSNDAQDAGKIAGLTKTNRVVDVYTDSDGKVNKVVVVTYKAKKVTKEGNDLKIDTMVVDTTKFPVKENDVVLYTASGTNLQSVEVLEPLTATMATYTTKDTKKTYSINNVTYVEAETEGKLDGGDTLTDLVGKEATYYVGPNNTIIYGKAVSADDPAPAFDGYAVIQSVHVTSNGWPTTTYKAEVQILTQKGTLEVYELPVNFVDEDGSDTSHYGQLVYKVAGVETKPTEGSDNNTSTLETQLKNKLQSEDVYAYSVEDGVITLVEAPKDATSSSNKKGIYANKETSLTINTTTTSIKVATSYTAAITSETIFVLQDEKDATKFVTKVGPASLESTTISAATGVVMVEVAKDNDTIGVVRCVFLTETQFNATEAEPEDAKDYVYVNGEVSSALVGDKTVNTVTGLKADGTSVTLTCTSETVTAGIYKYKDDGSLGEALASASVNPFALKGSSGSAKVGAMIGNVLEITGAADSRDGLYTYTTDAVVVVSGELKTDAKVYGVANNNKEIVVLFVVG